MPRADRSSKRRNITQACDSCKLRKKRCDGASPCAPCSERDKLCTYHNRDHRGRTPRDSILDQADAALTSDEPSYEPMSGGTSHRASRAASPLGHALISPEQYVGPSSPFWFLRRALHAHGQRTRSSEHATDTSIFSRGDRIAPSVDDTTVQLPSVALCRALIDHYFNFAAPTYRFYHKPTVLGWLRQAHADASSITPTQTAAIFVILATSSLYSTSTDDAPAPGGTPKWEEAESFFQKAQEILSKETGRITLESVQSRLSSCLFLLNTSRANKAWFSLGSVVQLCSALGLHSRRSSRRVITDRIGEACRKRTFWCVYTLDVYLSLMLGRPSLLHDDDITQEEPDFVNDEDLTNEDVSTEQDDPEDQPEDCIAAAAIHHARLARILKQASKEQSRSADTRKSVTQQQQLRTKTLNQQVENWERVLPVYLSGAIRPSSLIPVLARQHSLLKMAHAHAVMVLHRQSLLTTDNKADAQRCLTAAKLVVDHMRKVYSRSALLPAFWYFQYITFNALSVIYIHIIYDQSRGDLQRAESLLKAAEEAQAQLSQATQYHAPGLRYGAILEGLHSEASRKLLKRIERLDMTTVMTNDLNEQVMSNISEPADFLMANVYDNASSFEGEELVFTPFDTGSTGEVDFWSMLEAMPFNDRWQDQL